jgi:hypothetical protein
MTSLDITTVSLFLASGVFGWKIADYPLFSPDLEGDAHATGRINPHLSEDIL